jgi:hypothetical protein
VKIKVLFINLDLGENQDHFEESKEDLLDYPCEIEDHICDKVLEAGGNLTINFYCLLLLRFIDSELDSSKNQLKCYQFVQYYSDYLQREYPISEFTDDAYNHFIDYFAHLDEDEEPTNEDMLQELDSLQYDVSEMILGSITKGKEKIEDLLIKLVGHENATVRSCAIKYLNCIYDGNLWKLESPMSSEVKLTGDSIEIKFTPTIASTSYYLLLNFPYRGKTAISYHRIPKDAQVGKEIKLMLGKFDECGFYDYKIMRFKKASIENIEHHRFIVHNKFIKHANIHEICVDLFKAEKDPSTGIITSRGNFKKIAKSIEYLHNKGIDTLYIAGVHKRSHDDPYSVASRIKLEESLGGEQVFKNELVEGMHDKDMKVIVDLFDRIGSLHMAKRYRSLLLNHINSKRIFTHFHGANGKSNFSFSNTSILNYRKKEAWDLLVEEAVAFVEEFGVDGLHLDNCNLWPTMKRINKAEMYRKDADGEQAYSNHDILEGQVIDPEDDRIIWPDCTD